MGHANAKELAAVKLQTNGRQKDLIKAAMEEVARDHPELVTEAVANELVRTVLDGILTAHLDDDGAEHAWRPRRRQEDWKR